MQAILTPATPSAAFGIGEKGGSDPIEMYLNDIFTVTVNMAGLPGIAVPAGLSAENLPLGLQLIGRPFEEETLFSLGHVIEEAAGHFAPQRWWAVNVQHKAPHSTATGTEADRIHCVAKPRHHAATLGRLIGCRRYPKVEA